MKEAEGYGTTKWLPPGDKLRTCDEHVQQPIIFFFLSVSIVIGIPSIRRPLSTYLYDTIKSLLDGMDDADKADTLIFVCVLEVSATTSSWYLSCLSRLSPLVFAPKQNYSGATCSAQLSWLPVKICDVTNLNWKLEYFSTTSCTGVVLLLRKCPHNIGPWAVKTLKEAN